MFVLSRTYAALAQILGGSIDELYAHIAAMGGAVPSTAIPVKAGLEKSVLARLSATQARLNEISGARENAEREIRALNIELEARVEQRTAELRAALSELTTRYDPDLLRDLAN